MVKLQQVTILLYIISLDLLDSSQTLSTLQAMTWIHFSQMYIGHRFWRTVILPERDILLNEYIKSSIDILLPTYVNFLETGEVIALIF